MARPLLPADAYSAALDVLDRLREENRILSEEVRGVSDANARAAELMVELEAARELLAAQNEELRNQQVALADALERSNAASKAKALFLANMSHEIRTPMNGVLGVTSLLLESGLTPQQGELVDIIRRSAESLLSVINAVLDFSRIESGKLEIEKVDFDFRDVVEDVLDLLGEQAARKNIELIGSFSDRFPALVRGDPGRLRQVITNLAGNAVKFTDCGEVEVRAEWQSGVNGRELLRCEVRDTGSGIPPAVQPRLFKVFSQGDPSTTRRHAGTGLGLAICKQIVEALGGEIGLDSREGAGSTFWFCVPLECAPPEIPDGSETRQLEGRRVVVVDDNDRSRASLQALLTEAGAKVEAFARGREVIAFLRSDRRVDLVLIDHEMPDMNGIDLALAIRKEAPALAAPKLAMSARRCTLMQEQARRAGFVHCFAKPVRRSSLLNAVKALWDAGSRTAGCDSAAPVTGSRPPFRGRLLVAEDSAINQKVASAMLERLGFQVDIASNGVEAVEAARQGLHDAILMDCHMPELDGYAATRRIREDQGGGRRVPVIAMTANDLQGDCEECLAAGMDDYLAKPVTMVQLEAALRRWVSP